MDLLTELNFAKKSIKDKTIELEKLEKILSLISLCNMRINTGDSFRFTPIKIRLQKYYNYKLSTLTKY